MFGFQKDFNFERKDWTEVAPADLPTGSNLVSCIAFEMPTYLLLFIIYHAFGNCHMIVMQCNFFLL